MTGPLWRALVFSLETCDRAGDAGYSQALGVETLALDASHARLRLPYAEALTNGDGVLQADLLTLTEVLQEHGWATGASVSAFVTTRVWGFDQGFDVYMDRGIRSGGNFWHGSRAAEPVIDDALRWKESRPDGEPLFLWVHLYDPHFPYQAPGASDDAHPYDAEIAFADAQIGRLVRLLDDLALADDTLVVVAGDHGEGLGQHDEGTHACLVYQSTLHVPLILRCGRRL